MSGNVRNVQGFFVRACDLIFLLSGLLRSSLLKLANQLGYYGASSSPKR